MTIWRPALALVTCAAALAATVGAAAAGRSEPYLGPPPTPLPTLGPFAAPGPAVLATQQPDACANDRFLAYRAVPLPGQYTVTVCGVAVALPAAAAPSGTAAARFALVADGTAPVALVTGAAVKPGDTLLVHGRYQRDRSSAEAIVAGYVVVNGVPAPAAAQR